VADAHLRNGRPAPDCARGRLVGAARLVRYPTRPGHIAALVKLTGYLDSVGC